MPRRTATQLTSAIDLLRKQARQLLTGLRQEIQSSEARLRHLKWQQAELATLMEARRAMRFTGVPPSSLPEPSRTDWSKVLDHLPKRFQTSDVRGIGNLKNKRSQDISAAITRWMESGAVKRKGRGLYERAK